MWREHDVYWKQQENIENNAVDYNLQKKSDGVEDNRKIIH